MKKILLLLLLAPAYFCTHAQSIDWLQSASISYSLNPHLPRHFISVSGNNIFSSRLDTMALSFGSDLYGTHAIECYDSSGVIKWSKEIGNKSLVTDIASDNNGNLFVGGKYMETFHLDGIDSLQNTGSGFDINLFLLCLDSSGTLLWKRNVSLTFPAAIEMNALAIDAGGSCWYAIQDFSDGRIIKLDNAGSNLTTHFITGIRIISSISFDEFNNLFFSGSTESGIMSAGSLSIIVPETYMMFVGRFDASGNPSWIRLAHDVTFQQPQVVATVGGNAYLGGPLLDSTTWGSVFFLGPQWVADVFLTRIDSLGNFLWGIEVPVTPSIVGDFAPGLKKFIDADALGNVYMTGMVRGTVDWGNGVVTSSGSLPSDRVSIIAFTPAGIPRWAVSGGSANVNVSYNIDATATDHLYFSIAGSDTVTFDTLFTNAGGGYGACLGKIIPEVVTGVAEPKHADFHSPYPNPTSGHLKFPDVSEEVNVYIFDSNGKEIAGIFLKPGRGNQQLEIGDLPEGIYFYRSINSQDVVSTGKFILMK